MSENTATSINPPLVDLPIRTAQSGFYHGFSTIVTIPAKVIVTLLIVWAVFFPNNAETVLAPTVRAPSVSALVSITKPRR